MPLAIDGTPTTPLTVTIYGTLQLADDYFDSKLFADTWTDATDADKVKALSMATKAIDNLDFRGEKSESTQVLSFPRTIFPETPDAILVACYECAFAFLDGVNIEEEIANARISSETFSSMKEISDVNIVPIHFIVGIPSAIAWYLLRPYVKDGAEISLKRVN
jgi:hypothetical protein